MRPRERSSRYLPRGAVEGVESTGVGLDDPGFFSGGEERIGGLPGAFGSDGIPRVGAEAKQRLARHRPADAVAERHALDVGWRRDARPAAPALDQAHVAGATHDLRLRRPEHRDEGAAWIA